MCGNALLNDIKGRLRGHEIEAVSEQNIGRVFEVYDSNTDFFLLTQGGKATAESCAGDMAALPPGCTAEQKIYVGIWKGGRATAVLDLIEGYPAVDAIWIGLLLVHGDMHGLGTGGAIAGATLGAAAALGYASAQLGVIESNARGLSFWRGLGFSVSRRSGNIIVMEKALL